MGTGSGVADVPSGGSSALLPQVARASGKKWGHSSFPSKRGQTCSRSVPFCPRSGEMRNVPISFLAAARRKPTGLNVCKNGCAEMHYGGPYWLPPRRAPFGCKENPPQAGVPPDSASPRSLVTVCEEARASMACQDAGRQNPAIPLYWHTGTELQVVVAGAWIAVSGSAHGERRVSSVRRAAPLWWFSPDLRVSAPPIER